jgi:hypothetical protein
MPTTLGTWTGVACFSENVVIEDPRGERMMTGRAEMHGVYAQLFANSPMLRAEVTARIQPGAFTVDEETRHGYGEPWQHATHRAYNA